MSLKYVVGFHYPSSGPNVTNYNVYFDTGSNAFNVVTMGPDPQTTIDLSEIGFTEGQQITLATQCSDNPNTTLLEFFITANTPFSTVQYTADSPSCPLNPDPGGCTAVINSLVVTNETSTGANDGTVTINASSESGGLTYSIDGSTYVSGNVFANIAPGNYTASINDADDCGASQPFSIQPYINPVQNFGDDLPIIDLGGGNISRWNAAFNPIVVQYQRKDYIVTSIFEGDNPGQIKVNFSTALTLQEYNLAINDQFYVKTPLYNFSGRASGYTTSGGNGQLIVTEPYVGDDGSGFANINGIKPGYYVESRIKYGLDAVHPKYISAQHNPSSYNGSTRADLSPFLQTIVNAKDEYNYTDQSYTDINRAASFQLSFREVWDTGSTQYFDAPYPMYVVFAAMQLGHTYGGNMAEFVPFETVISSDQKAHWLTGFESPVMWSGLPFELSFIYSENVINQQLYIELVPDCGDLFEGLLLNADAGYLLNADTSRFVITRLYNPDIQGYSIIQALGLTRCLIPDVFDCCATEIVANIYYLVGEEKVYIMQPLTIRHVCPCDDENVYLKWINYAGGWDYYRFGFNQFRNATVTNDQSVTRFVTDWQNDDTIQDNIYKTSIQSIQVGADLIDKDDANSLQWARKGIKAMMLVNNNPVKWQTVIIKDGDTDTIQSRKPKSSVRFTLYLPQDNLQNQ